MKKLCKHIIAGVFAFVILFFSCMPTVHAISFPDDRNIWDLMGVDVVDLFDWAYNVGTDHVTMGFNFLRSLLDDDFCPNSPDIDGLHSFVEKRTQVNGQFGNYYICEYCSKSAGEVGQDAYTDYTASLPATGYTSDGRLIWRASFGDVAPSSGYNFNFCASWSSFGSLPVTGYIDGMVSAAANYENNFVNIDFTPNRTDWRYSSGYLYFKLVAPISGSYAVLPYSSLFAYGQSSDGLFATDTESYTYEKESYTFHSEGDVFSSQKASYQFSFPIYTLTFARFYWYFPVYEIIPVPSYSDTYTVTTRPTSIVGANYGIVGDDGQLTIVTVNDTIVNETNNTYYNPATGNSETINNWSYDYTDRSYNVTLESGDTVTVTYGDQYITVVENNVTYIIYYIIGDGCPSDDNDDPVNSGSPEAPGTSDHQHSWQETERIDPTCALPGQVNYICENCGQARVDVLSALGHKWRQKQFVPTAYDDDGALIQRGYTIYECSVCGEQYKDETGTGPPAVSDTVDDGGLISFFHTLIKSLSDNLSGAVELILSFFRRIPELFGGFLDFLSAMFPFLPDDIIFLLTFGMAAVVFVGIIKAIRR